MMKAVFEKLEFTTVCFHDLTAKQIEWVFDEGNTKLMLKHLVQL